MVFKHELHSGNFGQFDFTLMDLLQNGFNLHTSILASLMVVEIWAMEGIRSRVHKLHKRVLGDARNHVIGVFLRDVDVEVLHFRRSEQRHLVDLNIYQDISKTAGKIFRKTNPNHSPHK